ncbi:hypothetical protein BJV77DRAFT_992093 [Russula vinacea]|nr:hypothetical protein BJV77DRAFT_992093 [Russula vinacea]
MFMFLFSLNLFTRPMPCLTTIPGVAPFHAKSCKQAPLQDSDPLRYLIRRHLTKSMPALSSPHLLRWPYQFSQVHVPQMCHHQVP